MSEKQHLTNLNQSDKWIDIVLRMNPWSLCYRKLIHHRKETLARRSSSSSGHKQGLPSSSSEISLSQTPSPPNGLNRDYGRQGNVPLSGSMDNMQAEQGFYQVTQSHTICNQTATNFYFIFVTHASKAGLTPTPPPAALCMYPVSSKCTLCTHTTCHTPNVLIWMDFTLDVIKHY